MVLSSTNDTGTRDEDVEVSCGGEQAPDGEEVAPEKQRTPLPVRQLFVLCLMRFAEPISFSVVSIGFTDCVSAHANSEPRTKIFPFVNQVARLRLLSVIKADSGSDDRRNRSYR